MLSGWDVKACGTPFSSGSRYIQILPNNFKSPALPGRNVRFKVTGNPTLRHGYTIVVSLTD